MQQHSLQELIYHMRTVISSTESEWKRGFAVSILKHSKRPSWKPSAKQMRTMRNLIDDMFGPDIFDNEGGFEAA